MLTIHKFAIPLERESNGFSIPLPPDAEILKASVQSGVPYLWVLLDLDQKKTERRFVLIATGEEVKQQERLFYVETLFLRGGALVMHLFEVLDA